MADYWTPLVARMDTDPGFQLTYAATQFVAASVVIQVQPTRPAAWINFILTMSERLLAEGRILTTDFKVSAHGFQGIVLTDGLRTVLEPYVRHVRAAILARHPAGGGRDRLLVNTPGGSMDRDES